MDTSRYRILYDQMTPLTNVIYQTKVYSTRMVKGPYMAPPATQTYTSSLRMEQHKKTMHDNNNKAFFRANGYYPQSDYSFIESHTVVVGGQVLKEWTYSYYQEYGGSYGVPLSQWWTDVVVTEYAWGYPICYFDWQRCPEIFNHIYSAADLRYDAVGDHERVWTQNAEGLTEVIRERAMSLDLLRRFQGAFNIRNRATEQEALETAFASGDKIVHPLDYYFALRPTVDWLNALIGEARFVANQNVSDMMLAGSMNGLTSTAFKESKSSKNIVEKFHGSITNGKRAGHDQRYTFLRKVGVHGTIEVDTNKFTEYHQSFVKLGLFPTLTTIWAVTPWSYLIEPLLELKPLLTATSLDMLGMKTYYAGEYLLEFSEFENLRNYKVVNNEECIWEAGIGKYCTITRDCTSFVDELNPQGISGPAFSLKALMSSWSDESWAFTIDPPWSTYFLGASTLWEGITFTDPQKCTKSWRRDVSGVTMGRVRFGAYNSSSKQKC